MQCEIHPWKVLEKTFHKEQMRLNEELTFAGNGFLGLLGSFEEDYSGDSCEATYISGCMRGQQPLSGIRLHGIRVEVDGQPLDLHTARLLEFSRELDLQTGLFVRRFVVETEKGRIAVKAERFVSLSQKELLAVRYSILPEYSAHITMRPNLDANAGNKQAKVWKMLAEEEGEDGVALLAQTTLDEPGMTAAAAMSCWADGLEMESRTMESGYVESVYSGFVEAGDMISMEKFALCFTNREYDEKVLTTLALRAASRARELGYDELRADHIAAWKARWACCDVTIDGDESMQQRIRYALFRLSCIYDGENEPLCVPVESLYQAMPVYLAAAGQDAARRLLEQPVHMTDIRSCCAFAYAVFQYATYTGDFEFPRKDGLKRLYEAAEVCFGQMKYVPEKDQYLLSEDSWYESRMAAWCVGLFVTQAHRASKDRLDRLGISPAKLSSMLSAAAKVTAAADEALAQQISGQPDVLQGLYQLNHLFEEETIRRHFDGCWPEVTETLQPAACVLAAQLGEDEKVHSLCRHIFDASDAHEACWLAVAHGFGGMRTAEGLQLGPCLPRMWTGYAFRFQYRGRIIGVEVMPQEVRVELLEGAPLDLTVYGKEYRLADRLVCTR